MDRRAARSGGAALARRQDPSSGAAAARTDDHDLGAGPVARGARGRGGLDRRAGGLRHHDALRRAAARSGGLRAREHRCRSHHDACVRARAGHSPGTRLSPASPSPASRAGRASVQILRRSRIHHAAQRVVLPCARVYDGTASRGTTAPALRAALGTTAHSRAACREARRPTDTAIGRRHRCARLHTRARSKSCDLREPGAAPPPAPGRTLLLHLAQLHPSHAAAALDTQTRRWPLSSAWCRAWAQPCSRAHVIQKLQILEQRRGGSKSGSTSVLLLLLGAAAAISAPTGGAACAPSSRRRPHCRCPACCWACAAPAAASCRWRPAPRP